MPDLERKRLTAEMLESDADVSYAITALKSLGVMSADQAVDKWEITIIPRGDWEQTKGTSAIHLFPWGEKKEGGRSDKAWFMVNFDHDGSHSVTCKRDASVTTDHITLSSERALASTYPKIWTGIGSFTQGNSVSFRLDSKGEIISIEAYEKGNYFRALKDVEGTAEIDKALERIGKFLHLGQKEMPGRTTFNPGALVNTILDQGKPFDIPQMIGSART